MSVLTSIIVSAVVGVICGIIGYKYGKQRQISIIYQSVPHDTKYESNDDEYVPPLTSRIPSKSGGRIK